MNETITLRWSTGSMELVPPMLLTLSAAQLKKIVQTATLNADEVKTEIAGYIQGEIEQLNPKSEYDKRTIVQYKKLIEACGERKQSKQEKAIKRIVDSVDDCRPQFNGMFQNDGKYCICTGYMAIRSSAPFYGIDEKENNFDMSKAFGNISAYSMPLELPSVKELKSDMKIARIGNTTAGHVRAVRLSKTRCNYLYDFGYGLPLVNAKYLVDMLEALPDCKAFCNPDNNTFSLVYFVSGENDGILLSMRKGIEWEAAPEEKPIEQAAPAVEETPIEKPVEAAVEEVKADPAPAVDEVKEDPEPVSAEKLNQIETPLESRQVYGYKPDGNTVTAHRWKVYHVTGNLYLRETVTDKYGQRFANIVLMHPCAKIGLDMGSIGQYQLDHYSADFLAERIGFSTVDEFNAHMEAVIANDGYIRNSYIAFVRQYDSALAQRMEKREVERRAEYLRKQEQQRREREQEIADEITQAEQAIISGGKIDNTVTDGKCLFLRLFEKYGVKVAIRSKGWIIEKLVYVLQNADGGAQVSFRKSSKYEKISGGFTSAYWELREILLTAQKEAEEAAKEAAEAVSAETAEDPAPIPDVPADTTPAPDKPAPVAPSAPIQAAQDTAVREAKQIVTAISPAFLRLFCASVRDGCRPDGTGLDRTKPDKSGVSAALTVDRRTVYNTS